MNFVDLEGKTIKSVESKEVGYDDNDAWEIAKIECTDGSIFYLSVDNPSCTEIFYGTLKITGNPSMWDGTGDYEDLKELE